jgi:hypothetical protein
MPIISTTNITPIAPPAGTLTQADLAAFARLKIPPELLAKAGVRRVTDAEARTDYGMRFDVAADLSGVLFRYYSPVTGKRTTARVRRDHPETDADGKLLNKYISAWGDGRHLYFLPGSAPKLGQPDMPVCLVEAEKSALALTAWAERTGTQLLPVAMGGCYGWRGVVGKTETSDGERVDVKGALADLSYCDGHRVYVALDANAATNPDVRAARTKLCADLRRRKCEVLVVDVPIMEGVNGPDDFIAVAGDDAMAEVFAAAHKPTRKLAVMPAPKPAAPVLPPFAPDEAAAATSDLLVTLIEWINTYVVVTVSQAVIMATWILHTWVIDAAQWTPYLHITGPEKSCGKTLLIDTLSVLAYNPRTSSGVSPAALLRLVDKHQPSLFLDEMDAATNGNKELAETQRGILNAGAKRGSIYYKCDGKDHELREFKAFGPKCFGGIGDIPATIASRSITIEMRRKLPSESIERFRSRVVDDLAAPIRADLEIWAAKVLTLLTLIQAAPIDALSDRANDIVEPLLAIAQLAGGDWLQRLTGALLAVYGATGERDASSGVTLLADIKDVFDERGGGHIPSKELAAALCEIEGRSWAEWSRGRGLSPNNLARQLAKYHIYPTTIRAAGEVAKGYRRGDFVDAWARYAPAPVCVPPFVTVTALPPAPPLSETHFCNRNTTPAVTVAKSAPDPHKQRAVTSVTVEKGDTEIEGDISAPADAPPDDGDGYSIEALLGVQHQPVEGKQP